MTAARLACAILLLAAVVVSAQEDLPPVPGQETGSIAAPQPRPLPLQEFEQLAIGALRKEFPRPSGIMASTNSCRLPDYGPLISVTLQLPPVYFTAPVLKELEMRQRMAEERARIIRTQLNRTAEIIRLRAREADLLEQLEGENKKKGKAMVASLQSQLDEVRENIKNLDTTEVRMSSEQVGFEIQDVDLEKMMSDNYQEAIQRITVAMRSVLAENAARVADMDSGERVSIATHIRENFLSSKDRSILFILKGEDIRAFRSGEIDLAGLRQKVLVKHEMKE